MNIYEAIFRIHPGAKFIPSSSISQIEWLDETTSKPSEAEIMSELARLQKEYEDSAYARSRALEYPPITDYIDGVVKGDQAQIDAYIAACLAVKAKYPKPE